MSVLPWRRALPPAEPPLGMITLLFPPAREPERDRKPDDEPDPDSVVFGPKRVRGKAWG